MHCGEGHKLGQEGVLCVDGRAVSFSERPHRTIVDYDYIR